jgi:hypothetical protein
MFKTRPLIAIAADSEALTLRRPFIIAVIILHPVKFITIHLPNHIK